MGRHKAMAPMPATHAVGNIHERLASAEPSVSELTTTSAFRGDEPVWAPSDNDIDTARLQRLQQVRVRVPDSPLVKAVTDVSALVWVRTPGRSAETDRKDFRLVIHSVLADAITNGDIDVRRALRKAAVDRYLDRQCRTSKMTVVRTTRTVLYAAGRVLHPGEFPALPTLWGPRARPNPPVTDAQLRDLYALIGLVSEGLGRRLTIVLDLCAGAGLRTNEVRHLRGTDIVATAIHDRNIAVVHPVNTAGQRRAVPVTNPGRARRLVELADQLGDGLVLPNALKPDASKNAVNRVNEELIRKGHRRFDAAGLRNHWIIQVAQEIPASMVLQLADLKDGRVLTDQFELLGQFDTETVATRLWEAGL